MARGPNPGACVHCGRPSDDLTWDHVFPRAWYPDDTPPNLEKWKIPSCRECNAAYGELEQDLLLRLGMCIGPEEAKASGIAEKVIRSIDPRAARDPKDQLARARKHVSLGRAMVDVGQSQKGVLPGFGPSQDSVQRSSRGITIGKGSLERLGEKIIRGITYLATGRRIGEDYLLEVMVVGDEAAAPVREILEQHGILHERGPGIAVSRAPADGDPISAVFAIEIWGRVRLYGGVHPRVLELGESEAGGV